MSIYVRTVKRKSGRVYYWLVSNRRAGDKWIQKKLHYFGAEPPSPEQVEEAKQEAMQRL